ncbi:MAG: serine hydrolase [Ilumatobacteraceae bacterium]
MSIDWSFCVLDDGGGVVDESDADLVHSTASIGKVFLLCEAAELIASRQLDPDRVLTRHSDFPVADSGLWQHLRQETLPLVDVCQLIGAVSDNWATNTLLDVIGIDAVAARALSLGCVHSTLHDYVRDERGPEHPVRLSSGTARELAEVARRIHAAAAGACVEGITCAAAAMVERWLMVGVDLSLVGATLHLDPLAHMSGDLLTWSKTGFDTEVRADMGVVWSADHGFAYAALATWPRGAEPSPHPVDAMNALGRSIAERLAHGTGD